MSKETNSFDLLNKFEDVEKAFTLTSKPKDDFLTEVFFETEMTKRIRTVKWDDRSMLVIAARTSQWSSEKIRLEINRKIDGRNPKFF